MTTAHGAATLGTGLIGNFYTATCTASAGASGSTVRIVHVERCGDTLNLGRACRSLDRFGSG